ncbi:MAG: YitT family protein [Bacteroidota bacterium]
MAKNKKRKLTGVVRNTLFIVIGILSATFGLKSFILPNDFIDGGVTGISLLTSIVTELPLSLLIIIINAPFVYAGYRQVSKTFAITTSMAIGGLALSLLIFEFPIITNDKLLTAVFGGFFLGAGIGMCIRGGGVIDGTEILSILVSKRSSFTVGDILLIINVIIFSVAAMLLNIETALYSILTYMVAGRTVDYIIEGIEEYTGVIIISSKPDEIRYAIIEELGRGVTVLKGKGGYGKRGQVTKDVDVLYCVLTRLEISKLKAITERIDESVFMVMNSINDTKGGMIKKRPLMHK